MISKFLLLFPCLGFIHNGSLKKAYQALQENNATTFHRIIKKNPELLCYQLPHTEQKGSNSTHNTLLYKALALKRTDFYSIIFPLSYRINPKKLVLLSDALYTIASLNQDKEALDYLGKHPILKNNETMQLLASLQATAGA